MKEFEQAKQEYENIEIPKELSERVNLEISRAEEKRKMKAKKAKVVPFGKWAAAAAGIVLGGFIIGLNGNQAFAQTMGNMPVIGGLAKVLTFREYEVNTEDYIINIEIPTIDMISEDFSEFEESINTQILEQCEMYAEESKLHALEYREAFLETGGTLEEWIDHDIRIKVWYEVLVQTDEYLSLSVNRTESWNSAGTESTVININLPAGEEVSHEELLEETGTTYYEDNFAVDAEAAAAYAEKIQTAVAEKDMEKLAELTGFPVYVGVEEGIVVETKEDFIALGSDKVITQELADSIANTDVTNLVPSMAGFWMSGGDTPPSITFSVVSGELKITGINY